MANNFISVSLQADLVEEIETLAAMLDDKVYNATSVKQSRTTVPRMIKNITEFYKEHHENPQLAKSTSA